MFEEPFYLTKTEAEYCLLIAGITAGAGRGIDIGAKAEALIGRLEAEMKKPEKSRQRQAQSMNIHGVIIWMQVSCRRSFSIAGKKDLFFRAFVGETTESAMSSVGKREYELLHDTLNLCTVYYAKEER